MEWSFDYAAYRVLEVCTRSQCIIQRSRPPARVYSVDPHDLRLHTNSVYSIRSEEPSMRRAFSVRHQSCGLKVL